MNQPAILVSLAGLPDTTLVVQNLSELIGAVSLLLNPYSPPRQVPKLVYKRQDDIAILSLDVAIQTLAPGWPSTERVAFAIEKGLGYKSTSPKEAGLVFFAY